MFLVGLDHLEAWAMGIGDAHLEAKTQEKVCIASDHNHAINKALCGLCTSSVGWHKRLSDCLCDMNSNLARLSLTSECSQLMAHVSALVSVWMTLLLRLEIHRPLSASSWTSTTSS